MRRLDGRTLACLQKTGAALACMHLRVAALRLVVRGCAVRDLHAVLECAGACDLLHVLAGGLVELEFSHDSSALSASHH